MRRNAAKRRATQAAAGDVSEDATGRSVRLCLFPLSTEADVDRPDSPRLCSLQAEKIDHSRGFDDLTDLANPSFRYSY